MKEWGVFNPGAGYERMAEHLKFTDYSTARQLAKTKPKEKGMLKRWLERKINDAVVEQLKGFRQKIDVTMAEVKSQPKATTCEKCGCMVFVDRAVRGKSEVRSNPGPEPIVKFGLGLSYTIFPGEPVEYLYTPYFCKRCAPKKKEQGRGD